MVDAQRRLDDAHKEIVLLRESVSKLQRRADKQSAVLQAVLDVFGPRLGVPPAELLGRVKDADASSGSHPALAAAPAGGPKHCDQCRRAMGPRQVKCLYCGAARAVEE